MAFEIEDGVLNDFDSGNEEESVVIPDGIRVIGSGAFRYCGNVKSVVIPDSVEEICDGAFKACGIRSIVIPDSVKKIESDAFTECSDLKSVVVGRGVSRLESCTFRSCQILEHLELPPGLEKVGYDCFEECYTLKYAWVDGVKYRIRDSSAPKPVQLVYDSIEASRIKIVRYYESGMMDEFEYIDYCIAGDGYSF